MKTVGYGASKCTALPRKRVFVLACLGMFVESLYIIYAIVNVLSKYFGAHLMKLATFMYFKSVKT